MLEILVVMAAIAIGIAAARRRGSSRARMSKYIRGMISEDIDLGTLAARTAVLESTATVVDTTRVTSIEVMYSLANFTPTADVGPIMVGVAHSDYTLAEVEAFIELASSWTAANLVNREISNRLIRRIGTFEIPALATESAVLNDGKPIKTKLNWRLSEGQGLNFWAYNLGESALVTTTPNMHLEGHANLFGQ